MGAHFIYNNKYFILFLACLISRISTSIFFIEDIDSLRFAYSVIDEFNLLKLQPHFPGYAVFCFLANILYDLIGNMGLVFSLIGGISTYLIIFFSLQLLNYKIESKEGVFITLLIFFNPMIWLMGNRYMPDLMGLSFLIMTFYFLYQNNNQTNFGSFLLGILIGIRVSYIPFLIIPYCITFFKSNKKFMLLSSFCVGITIWLFPMIAISGFDNVYTMGLKHINGHFNEYGGTIITETNWQTRLQYFFHTIWSDGFGGYWINRSFFTFILSLLFIPFIALLIKNIKFIIKENTVIQYLLLSSIAYIIWILPFQNIIHKSRHVMPLVLVLIILFSIIFKKYFFKKNKFVHIYISLLILFMSYVTINLNIQHKNPTAINKISEFLIDINEPMIIISIPLINYYLKSQNLNAEFKDIQKDFRSMNIDLFNKNNKIIVIGDFIENIQDINFVSDTTFYHNPYINRMWSNINVYSNRKF